MKIRNICYGYHYADGKIAVNENEATPAFFALVLIYLKNS